jgi:hypothetical protein
VLRKVFGPKKKEVTRNYGKLHNKNFVKMMILRRMTGERHVALDEAKRNIYILLMRKPKERDRLEDLEVDGRTILKDILKR